MSNMQRLYQFGLLAFGITALAGGCAQQRTEAQLLEAGAAVQGLQRQQVLRNLAALIESPAAIPFHVDTTTAVLAGETTASVGFIPAALLLDRRPFAGGD